jgi:hypothetical protein
MLKKAALFFVTMFIAFVIIGFTLQEKEKAEEFEWGNLKNLGPNINSPGKDEHITFMPCGKLALFASIREGGMGKYDLYMTRYENGEWTKAELLPAPLNTEKDEFDPSISPDGKKMFFATNRDNSDPYWDCDIWVADWDGEKWVNPRVFDPIFVTPNQPDWGSTMPADFSIFYFSSGREPAKPQMVQMFQSKWLDDKWSEPEVMPEPVNTGEWEATPYVTPDGKFLYLNTARGEEGKKDVDIWRFELVDGKWTNATLMTGPFLSDKHDYDPCISPDGEKFYITSDREGTLGGADIWVLEKIYKK